MNLSVLTLCWDPEQRKIDDGPLRAFLDDPEVRRDVLSDTTHFFTQDGAPGVLLVLRHRDSVRPSVSVSERVRDRNEARDSLDPVDRSLYDALRAWRGQEADRANAAPYMICNNRQMAQIARLRPRTLAALREIDGIGETKATRWGEAILAQT